jgi:hypothetical protein
MRRVLHLLTGTDDPLPQELIAHQRAAGECEVFVADLTGANPDYHAVLEQVFAADSVEVW